jgi:hypothetical protein
MRHRIGIILAFVIAGVLFFPGTWGYLRLLALAAVAGAGLLAGILIAVPWFSPLAAGMPGLLLLGWTGPVPGQRPAGGRPDPAAVRSLRRRL